MNDIELARKLLKELLKRCVNNKIENEAFLAVSRLWGISSDIYKVDKNGKVIKVINNE